MRIEAIRGRNIASLSGDFCLDFTQEPLASAGIFAISGPTGAGKSTLLDTMCLALFGKTPRTERAKEQNVKLQDGPKDWIAQNDARFLLRRGTGSGFAEVDFIAINGEAYRARWSVARARGKASGKLQSPTISLTHLQTGTPEPGKNKELQQRIVQLIGLTFEQFTRSVLLAQNDFSTFLKAEQADKAALLEKLTGTDIYSQFSKLIYERCNKEKEKLNQLLQQMQAFPLLTEEQLNELTAEAKQENEVLTQWQADQKTRQSLRDSLQQIQMQAKRLNTQLTAATEKEISSLAKWEEAKTSYQAESEKLEAQEKAFAQLQPSLQQARKLDAEIKAAKLPMIEAKQAYELARQQTQQNKKQKQEAEKNKAKAQAELEKLSTWLEKHKEKQSIAEGIDTLLVRLEQAGRQQVRLADTQKRQTAKLKERSTLLSEKQKAERSLQECEAKCLHTTNEIAKRGAALQRSNSNTILKEMDDIREKRELILLDRMSYGEKSAEDLRQKLEEGKPCPVCGSIHHPFASPESYARITQLSLTIDGMTRHIQLLSEVLIGVKKMEKRQEEAKDKLHDMQQQTMTCRSHDHEVEEKIKWIDEQLKNLSEDEQKEKLQLEEALKQCDELFGHDLWHQSWQNSSADFIFQLKKFAETWSNHINDQQKWQQTITQAQATFDTLQSLTPSLVQQEEATQMRFNEKVATIRQITNERKKILDGKNVDEVENQHQTAVKKMKEQLKNLQKTQDEHAALASQAKGEKEQLQRSILETNKTILQQETQLKTWQEEFNASHDFEDLDKAIEEKKKTINEIDFRLRTHSENLQRIAHLEAQRTAQQPICDNWEKLNELAGSADGGKFRRIAQGYTLDILLGYANLHLRELSTRYRLERVPETLALEVIDRDMCDEVRTIHSLSGGESFLVSLALALGLSSLSSNRMSVESLFIDEGFGSLDAETLRIALDALESLHAQGRKIGVISHVQEMTERIPVHIEVERCGNGKSIIRLGERE